MKDYEWKSYTQVFVQTGDSQTSYIVYEFCLETPEDFSGLHYNSVFHAKQSLCLNKVISDTQTRRLEMFLTSFHILKYQGFQMKSR